MAFIKVKIAPKIIPKKEDIYDKISRENREKEAKEKFDKLEKENSDKLEKERMLVIINKYLDSLDTQLTEKDSWEFWIFPDRSGFKKYKNKSLKYMQKMVNKDVEQYKNRNIALINIKTLHGYENKDTFHSRAGIMLSVNISIFPIDKNGILNGKNNSWGLDFTWHINDFSISKFSFKLLERILESVQTHKLFGTHLVGISLSHVINKLKKLKVNLDDVLKPLAGITI